MKTQLHTLDRPEYTGTTVLLIDNFGRIVYESAASSPRVFRDLAGWSTIRT